MTSGLPELLLTTMRGIVGVALVCGVGLVVAVVVDCVAQMLTAARRHLIRRRVRRVVQQWITTNQKGEPPGPAGERHPRP